MRNRDLKHTPGPWSIDQGVNDYFIMASNGRVCGYIERKADADLIAAAPEMLTALRGLRAEVTAVLGLVDDSIMDIVVGRTNLSVLKHWRDRAEDAIAVATGAKARPPLPEGTPRCLGESWCVRPGGHNGRCIGLATEGDSGKE